MSDLFTKNKGHLINIQPSILSELKLEIGSAKYTVSNSRLGLPTVNAKFTYNHIEHSIWLHSQYDPINEARVFASSQLQKDVGAMVAIYGFGLGYHIEELLSVMGTEQSLYIFELDIELFYTAMLHRDLSKILTDSRVKLFISQNVDNLSRMILEKLNLGVHFILHLPSVKCIPIKFEKFKFLLENWNLKKVVTSKSHWLLNGNIKENQRLRDPNVSQLFNNFQKKPFIIVSAGPSLNKNIHLLQEIKERAFIFAVGTSLKPLLKQNIVPDMFCIIDPDPITYKQIEGVEDLGIPFVYLISANSHTVTRSKGPRYVAYNEAMNNQTNEATIQIGGSVATAVLDLAIKFGGNPIIFVGQDLAYTENQTHVKGGMYGDQPNIKSLPNMRKVKGQNGEILDTSLGLLSFKHWIENKIMDHPTVRYINASEGGAFIEGCEHLPLREVIDQLI